MKKTSKRRGAKISLVATTEPTSPTRYSSIFRVLQYLAVFLFGVLLTVIVCAGIALFLYTRTVARQAQMTPSELVKLVRTSRTSPIVQTDNRKNVLVLGIDRLSSRDTNSVLTDTIMIASIGMTDGTVKLISLPRDLWIASQSAKINALYERQNQEVRNKNVTSGSSEINTTHVSLVSSVVTAITGLPVHHAVILDVETVGRVVDALGGLDIQVQRSFVDYQYPKTDIDVQVERTPNRLNEVVAFTQGSEHMSGTRVLQFIRSRKSTDPIEGTDDGRVARQQRVIAALLGKLKDPTLIRQPEVLGKMMALYRSEFDSQLPLSEVFAVSWSLLKHKAAPNILSYQLPVQGVTKDPVIYHPNYFPGGAWVYLPLKSDWSEIRSLVGKWVSQ